jgi:uncharacterized membrane protein YphA (DoxX/SURF4 family)
MAIPPLSLLVILLVGMSSLAGVCVLLGLASAALVISAACIFVFIFAVFVSRLNIALASYDQTESSHGFV